MPETLLANVPDDVRQRAARIRLACFDVDGVLTDGRLTFDDQGRESKSFHALDGLGLKQLAASGFEVALVSARSSPIVARRGEELGLRHVYQGETDKLARLDALRATCGLGYEQVAFTGDDVPELACMRKVGLAVAVANAHPWILAIAHWRTRLAGGYGAAREVCDLLLAAQGHAAAFHARYAGA